MSKKRKKDNKKFYAVTKGRKIGIFTTWNEASGSVLGFHGAAHKGYSSLEQAREAMRQTGLQQPIIFGETDEETDAGQEYSTGIHVEDPQSESEQKQNKETTSSQTCSCGQNIPEARTLKCNECHGRVHWACTLLPAYQVCAFVGSCRRYTCRQCADALFLSESVIEEMDRQKRMLYDDREDVTSIPTMTQETCSEQLHAEITDLKTIVYNLETSITNLAEQTHVSFEEMREHIALKNCKPSVKEDRADKSKAKRPENKNEYICGESPQQKPTDELKDKNTDTSTENDSDQITKPTKVVNNRQKLSSQVNRRRTLRKKTKQGESFTKNKKDVVTEIPTPSCSWKDDTLADFEDKQEEDENSSDDDTIVASSGEEEDTNDDHGSLPYVLIFHDETLDDIDPNRLGQGYGLHIKTKKMNKLEELKDIIDRTKATPETIVVHCGITDLKNETPKITSEKYVQMIKKIRQQMNESNIVISHALTSGDQELEAKGQVLKAYLFLELHTDKKISFLDYYFKQKEPMFKDATHLSSKGSSFIASRLGRYLEESLWIRPQIKRPRPKFQVKTDKEGEIHGKERQKDVNEKRPFERQKEIEHGQVRQYQISQDNRYERPRMTQNMKRDYYQYERPRTAQVRSYGYQYGHNKNTLGRRQSYHYGQNRTAQYWRQDYRYGRPLQTKEGKQDYQYEHSTRTQDRQHGYRYGRPMQTQDRRHEYQYENTIMPQNRRRDYGYEQSRATQERHQNFTHGHYKTTPNWRQNNRYRYNRIAQDWQRPYKGRTHSMNEQY